MRAPRASHPDRRGKGRNRCGGAFLTHTAAARRVEAARDTGHNFPEVIAFRDRRASELGGDADRALSPSSVSMPASAARGATRKKHAPRNASSSFRDAFGQWDPKRQRPELWNLYNARTHPGENVRVFPISN